MYNYDHENLCELVTPEISTLGDLNTSSSPTPFQPHLSWKVVCRLQKNHKRKSLSFGWVVDIKHYSKDGITSRGNVNGTIKEGVGRYLKDKIQI